MEWRTGRRLQVELGWEQRRAASAMGNQPARSCRQGVGSHPARRAVGRQAQIAVRGIAELRGLATDARGFGGWQGRTAPGRGIDRDGTGLVKSWAALRAGWHRGEVGICCPRNWPELSPHLRPGLVARSQREAGSRQETDALRTRFNHTQAVKTVDLVDVPPQSHPDVASRLLGMEFEAQFVGSRL